VNRKATLATKDFILPSEIRLRARFTTMKAGRLSRLHGFDLLH
jgi:hypothetical protein